MLRVKHREQGEEGLLIHGLRAAGDVLVPLFERFVRRFNVVRMTRNVR